MQLMVQRLTHHERAHDCFLLCVVLRGSESCCNATTLRKRDDVLQRCFVLARKQGATLSSFSYTINNERCRKCYKKLGRQTSVKFPFSKTLAFSSPSFLLKLCISSIRINEQTSSSSSQCVSSSFRFLSSHLLLLLHWLLRLPSTPHESSSLSLPSSQAKVTSPSLMVFTCPLTTPVPVSQLCRLSLFSKAN